MMGSSLSRSLYWCRMRRLGRFSLSDLGQGRGPRNYVDLLIQHGYVRVVDSGQPRLGVVATYELIRNPGAGAPVEYQGGIYDPNCAGPIRDPRQRIWAALFRQVGWRTLGDLIANAQTTEDFTRRYISALTRCGYLVASRLRNHQKILRLEKNTGPAAPIPEPGTGRLFDPNLGVFVEVRNEAA